MGIYFDIVLKSELRSHLVQNAREGYRQHLLQVFYRVEFHLFAKVSVDLVKVFEVIVGYYQTEL